MTRTEMRRRMARKKRRKIAVNIAVLVVAVAAGAAFVSAVKYDREQQKLTTAVDHVAHSDYKDDYLTLALPVVAEDLDDAESVLTEVSEVSVLTEISEVEEIIPEQGYLSDKIPLDYDIQVFLKALCAEYSVPYQIALAVIEAESDFNSEASSGNCYGYMQINSINQEWLGEKIGVTDLTDPLQNLQSGVFMLGYLYDKYGDWHKALTCYIFGESGAQKYVFSKGLSSSRYSRHVMELCDKWKEVAQ